MIGSILDIKKKRSFNKLKVCTININLYFSLFYVYIAYRTRQVNLPARNFRQDDDEGDEMT